MKLQRSTLILVVTALLLGGVVLLTESRQGNSGPEGTAQPMAEAAPVFDFEEADVVGLHIETQGQAVTFERDDEGLWQMTEPEKHPAEEAAIAFLLSRLTSDGLVKTTVADAANQAEFGLDVPHATVDLTLADGTTHALVLGDADFSGQNYYALTDPETIPLAQDAGEISVAIVSEGIFNGVDRPLEEWKAVVEAAPSETEIPAPAATSPENEAPTTEESPVSTPATPTPNPSEPTESAGEAPAPAASPAGAETDSDSP